MLKIKGNHDGKNGENQSYYVSGRGNISRSVLAKEVDAKKYPGYHTRTIRGLKYVADNPDSSKKDNVNLD